MFWCWWLIWHSRGWGCILFKFELKSWCNQSTLKMLWKWSHSKQRKTPNSPVTLVKKNVISVFTSLNCYDTQIRRDGTLTPTVCMCVWILVCDYTMLAYTCVPSILCVCVCCVNRQSSLRTNDEEMISCEVCPLKIAGSLSTLLGSGWALCFCACLCVSPRSMCAFVCVCVRGHMRSTIVFVCVFCVRVDR